MIRSNRAGVMTRKRCPCCAPPRLEYTTERTFDFSSLLSLIRCSAVGSPSIRVNSLFLK